MAGRGAAPKPDTLRQGTGRTNPNQFEQLHQDGEIRGFPLPEGDGYPQWHPQTQQWWDNWRRSPQAQKMHETDWDYLLDTALMHHGMWTRGSFNNAGELRQRVAKFGATPEDRMRLRQTIDEPGAQQNADVVPIQRADIRVMKLTD